MSIHEDFGPRLHARLQSELRKARDCLQRALDGSDRSLSSVQARQYSAAQLKQAVEHVNNAILAVEAIPPEPA